MGRHGMHLYRAFRLLNTHAHGLHRSILCDCQDVEAFEQPLELLEYGAPISQCDALGRGRNGLSSVRANPYGLMDMPVVLIPPFADKRRKPGWLLTPIDGILHQ